MTKQLRTHENIYKKVWFIVSNEFDVMSMLNDIDHLLPIAMVRFQMVRWLRSYDFITLKQ